MEFPIKLYNIDKNIINTNSILKSNCFYLYSYMNFDINIISGTGILFSVKEIAGQLNIQEGQTFSGNFGYTLYIPENLTSVEIEVSKNTYSKVYKFQLKLDNISDETNQHYNDLLVNNFLPTFDELEKAIPDEFNKSELIKRLLLDFKYILKYKGTKNSIIKFLNFIGFDQQNLNVSEEYFNRKSNTFNTNPNKETDIKTGNYYVLYDNFTDNFELDENNLPLRYIIIQNLDSFSQHLLHAISLANIYFTCEEQEIIFFGLNYSSNILNQLTIASTFNMIFENDVINFRKDLHIDLVNHINSELKKQLIKNCLLKINTIYKSEIKYYLIDESTMNNSELFFVDAELFDDGNLLLPYLTNENLPLLTENPGQYIINESFDLTKVHRMFGCVLHLAIESTNTYMEFEFYNTNNPLSKLTYPKQHLTDILRKIIVLEKTATYRLSVKVYDEYNNFMQYDYDIIVDNDIQRIDFDLYNSGEVMDNLNGLTIDIDSQVDIVNPVSNESKSFILPTNQIPDDLSTYFDVPFNNFMQWLTENDRYVLPTINRNFRVDDITETIPFEFIENWLSIISFKYHFEWELKIRIYDNDISDFKIITINQLVDYDKLFDKLFVLILDVYDRNNDNTIQTTKTPYYFITTSETGIDFVQQTYDFVLVNKITNEIKSIYNTTNVSLFSKKIPVNYNFPLFNIISEIVPEFVPYNSSENIIIKSIFPYLTNNQVYSLKLCDIFTCKLNDIYVVNQQNIVWKVYNSFTNELLYETNEYTLKYQINEKTCFDVSCDFVVNGIEYQIFKKSLISSFNG